MGRPSPKFQFGEWLPDQPDLDNPGVTEALNVLRVGGNYVPYPPLLGSGTAVPETVSAAAYAVGVSGLSLYVATDDGSTKSFLYVAVNGVPPWTSVSAATFFAGAAWSLGQYNELMIATNGADHPQYQTLNSGANFAQLTGAFGAAPIAHCVGVIGQFVILGNLTVIAGYAVQWSGINAPLDWPTPNSAQAIAEQSGLQYLDSQLGTVTGITEGDQWGLLLMTGGIVRMTYTGGDTVFQFDTIYRGPACADINCWVKVENRIFFVSRVGFFVTDGTTVASIGQGKVNNYFAAKADQNHFEKVRCGVDWTRRLVYWSFPTIGSGGVVAEVLAFNIDEGNWTHAVDVIVAFARGIQSSNFSAIFNRFEAFTSGNQLGSLTGTPQTATIISAEKEFNPGGRTLISGVKPLVSGPGTTTVKVGSRTNQNASVTFTSSLTPNASSGFADCMVDSRYHRAEIDVLGAFTQMIGGEFDADPTSTY